MKRGRYYNVRIKKGFVYTCEISKESGYIRVKRYKIKNWKMIRDEV